MYEENDFNPENDEILDELMALLGSIPKDTVTMLDIPKYADAIRSVMQIVKFVKEDFPDITKYIISAHSDANGITTPRTLGARSTDLAYEGRTLKEDEDVLRAILRVTKEDLLEACKLLYDIEGGSFTVMCDEEIAKRFEGEAEIFYNLK